MLDILVGRICIVLLFVCFCWYVVSSIHYCILLWVAIVPNTTKTKITLIENYFRIEESTQGLLDMWPAWEVICFQVLSISFLTSFLTVEKLPPLYTLHSVLVSFQS